MIQANDETDSLNKIRKIVVEVSDYRMAWVGYAENDTGKSVRPVADAGFDESYLQTLHISWADVERGRGPTGTAIRTGAPSTISNVGTDPRFAPWRHEAINRGYVSALSLPLQEGDTVFGALTIYAAYPDTFNDVEQQMLASLAGNLAYGITMLRSRRAHELAEEALRQSEARYRSLFQNKHTVMLIVDPKDGTFTVSNQILVIPAMKTGSIPLSRRIENKLNKPSMKL